METTNATAVDTTGIAADTAVSTDTIDTNSVNENVSTETDTNVDTKAPGIESEKKDDDSTGDVSKKKEPIDKSFEIKVNGKNYKLTEKEIITLAQKASGAEKKFQEAAELREKMVKTFEYMKENPIDMLAKLGIDVRDVAENYLLSQYERESMSEEQRKVYELEEKLKRYEEEKLNNEKTQTERETEAIALKYQNEITERIVDTLSKTNIPKTENTVKRMAMYIKTGIEEGMSLSDISFEKVAELVKNDYIRELSDVIGTADEDAINKILPNSVSEKIIKARKKVMESNGNRLEETIQPQHTTNVKKKKYHDLSSAIDDALGKIDLKF